MKIRETENPGGTATGGILKYPFRINRFNDGSYHLHLWIYDQNEEKLERAVQLAREVYHPIDEVTFSYGKPTGFHDYIHIPEHGL